MRRTKPAALIFGIILVVVAAGLWIAVPVAGNGLPQTDPTAQQATVEAAVEMLYTQTAEAQTGVAMTQTVAAAFSAAQTATVAAVPVPPINADTLVADQIIEMPLLAGPGRTSAYLAPDGDRVAYFYGEVMCVFEIDPVAGYLLLALGEGGEFEDALEALVEMTDELVKFDCVPLDGAVRGVDQETIRWSPDGRYLVMAESFFKFLRDSDIWVLDTETMALVDITYDGEAKYDITVPASQSARIDVVPRWLPDGRIVFLRYSGEGEEYDPPYVYTVQPDGSDLQQVGQLETPQAFAVSALAVSAEGKLAYNLWTGIDEFEDLSGIWINDLDGGNARQVWHNAEVPNIVPTALDWSPDGQYIAFSLRPDFSGTYQPETSLWRAVRVSDGQEVFFSSEHFVYSAGWAPDGSAVIYTTGSVLDRESEGLYVAAEPGAPGRLLVPAHPDTGKYPTALMGTTSLGGQLLPWTARTNDVMVGRGGAPGVLIIRLAVP
jgi:dipeptidyl aminopeptidase/acylaminoacyl peptidase